MITSEEIKRRLWDGANELRGSMDASRQKTSKKVLVRTNFSEEVDLYEDVCF